MTKDNRCPYRLYSLTQQGNFDNQCILFEGHQGEHVKREIFPPPQVKPVEGWVKPTLQKESNQK